MEAGGTDRHSCSGVATGECTWAPCAGSRLDGTHWVSQHPRTSGLLVRKKNGINGSEREARGEGTGVTHVH